MGPNDPSRWDVPEVLKTLVSPLTFCGLSVVILGTLGGMVISTDLQSEQKLFGLVLVCACIVFCYHSVAKKSATSKDMVLDAEYHKQAQAADFISGNALTDFVDDRIHKHLAAHRPESAAIPQSERGKETLTVKRVHEELSELERS